jgi:hypothetical protein
MPILLAQLGDIHFREANDPAVERAPQIAAAIAAEVTGDTRSIILAICGDAAYAGTEVQFTIAEQFVESIESAVLCRCPGVTITRVVLPGNHDCNFCGDQAARNNLLGAINGVDKPPSSIAEIVLSPLSEYFEFAKRLGGDQYAITRANPFYHAIDIPDHGAVLRLHLLNTAWMSSMHERPGSLQFPLSEIAPPFERADCSIAILHHPTLWFSQPHVMRPLRDRIAELASVVLVNHEHVSEATEVVPLMDRDGGATKTLYISGGVIQESGEPERCTFNILSVNVSKKVLRLSRHEFRKNDGNPFVERTAAESIDLSANELNRGPAGVSLQSDMVKFLDDPGAPISHPHRDPRIPIRLRDIFLFPDLWELDADHDGKDEKQVKSTKAAEEVLATEKTLITGGEKSGRTAMLKSLFLTAFDAGKVPLFLKGEDVPSNKDKLRNKIREAVKEQYSNLAPDQFEQLHRSDRVVFVDDVHRMSPAMRTRKEVISELERQFATVVLCGDDLIKMYEMNGIGARDSGLWEYRHLIILGFGEHLRAEFVRKWLLLSGDTVLDDSYLAAEIDRICSLLNVVIRKQLLPTYPLFLLVVLQQSDLANASVQSGSFGKLFEGLMTAILNKSKFNGINIGDKHHYLAALSKKMYDDKIMYISVDAAKRWHRGYWDEIELDIDFNRLVSDLEYLGILTVSDTDLRFKYAYFFCFFLAYYLNRTLHQDEARTLIKQLCQQLHHRVSSEIVLFLAHMTGDPIVLDEMANTCDGLFSDVAPANLESDIEPLNRLGNVIESIAIPDVPDENRRQIRLRNDALVAERLAATKFAQEVTPPEAGDDGVKRLFDISAAYKTIQNTRAGVKKYRRFGEQEAQRRSDSEDRRIVESPPRCLL